MSTRELILLSPYRLPTQNALYLADDDVATFLHGYRALWHPAALTGAAGPPRPASPYDHEQPKPGFLYAVPQSPPLLLPDDWDQRVRAAGAVAFRATPDAAVTLANLRNALREDSCTPPDARALLDLDDERTTPFFGVGLAFLCLEALFEAMNHENQLSSTEFWNAVEQAVTSLAGSDADAPRRHLQEAAERLKSAREILYPVAVHLVDMWLPEASRTHEPWPLALDRGSPLNVIACASLLESWQRAQPERFAVLRERVAANLVEICGGPYRESEDALLPLESQLWNLIRGQATYQHLLGSDVRVFARKRFGHHHFMPLLLQNVGITRAALVAFDESVVPGGRGTTASWSSPDGKQVESFCRTPLPADSPQTFFHLTHHLHRTIMQDSAATLAFLHRSKPAHACYADLLALSRLAPVFGQWTTLSSYLETVNPGEYLSAGTPDDFHGDYLVERCPSTAEGEVAANAVRTPVSDPVSGFAHRLRVRRQLDTAWSLAALYRSMGGRVAGEETLAELEDRFESERGADKEIAATLNTIATALAGRLCARGAPGQSGFLVLNPCAFNRRVTLELNDARLPQSGPVKVSQIEGDNARAVVEVPAFGFAYVPRSGGSASAAAAPRMRLADERTVRNEFFEAEIDLASGGLKAIRDVRTRVGRLGQQLVFNPGSTMRVREVKVSSSGPALGEILVDGTLVDSQDEVLATYRQRFRAWLGRPTLELRIEIQPTRAPQGYPWHSYYACRFAWRDDRLTLMRGMLGTSYSTSHTRPETPDFLELRHGRQSTAIFPGGLPFHQRNGSRMLDVILIPEGETATVFEIGIALDREYPMQTALGLATPAPVVPIDRGPPHVGATGWLFHLDAPDLMLTTLRPAADGADAVIARLLECGFGGGAAQLRCVRNPKRAYLVDGRGQMLSDLGVEADGVNLDIPRNELAQVRIEFG
jgi:hypothetical protein